MDVSVLAHDGAWNQAVLIVVPLGAALVLVRVASRRGRAIRARREAEGTSPGVGTPPPDGDPSEPAGRSDVRR